MSELHTMLEHPHRRMNALTGEWVLVSPHRNRRPWLGQTEATAAQSLPAFDPQCYLCPGNTRANGERNPQYESTYVFTNDFPALLDEPHESAEPHALLRTQAVRGTCRVICFSPRHDLTLAQMSPEQIRPVVDAWAEQTTELGQRWRWVQVFENKGAMMGCSNPHPHGQIWASDSLPNEPAKELLHQRTWHAQHGRSLLLDYVDIELRARERIVLETREWLVVVPWWAVWPFETLIIPRRPVQRLPDLSAQERQNLAVILNDVLSRYDALFQTSFPYSMGWHGAPFDADDHTSWQLHAHVYPPLLRSANIRKFMVGYELLAEPQRDMTAEQAAERLRSLR